MDFKRILANALARRIAYVIVAALLAALGFSGKAHAQTYDQGTAWAECQNYKNSGTWVNVGCYDNTAQKTVKLQSTPGGSGAWTYHSFPYGTTCAQRSSEVTTRLPLNGSQQCINGCMTTYMQNGDDETSTRSTTGSVCSNTKDNCASGSFYNVLMNVCQPISPDCPEGQREEDGVCVADDQCPEGMVAVTGSTPGAIASGELYCKTEESECPAGNIKAASGECLPGEGQCAAGEALKKDGTCGKDANNDGVADDDDEDPENDSDKDSFSGGDSCDTPPSCSGSPIMCGQARIQWRIDCNTRKNRNISGGSCSAVPTCTGEKCDAMEYASLLMQWRTACALENAADAGESEGGDNQDVIDHLKAQTLAERDALQALGTADGLIGDEESKIWAEEGTGELPSTGLLGGGGATCTFSITIRGKVIGMSPQGYQILEFIRWLLIAAAYVWVAVQLGK